jgi:hypothetical protein
MIVTYVRQIIELLDELQNAKRGGGGQGSPIDKIRRMADVCVEITVDNYT